MRRSVEIDGEVWYVYPSGRVTVYDRDEFGLVFQKGTGPDQLRRVTKYRALGSRRPDRALGELSDRQLVDLFRQSQPPWTSPVTAYKRQSA